MNTSNNFTGQELLQYKQIKGILHLPALVYSLLCTSLDKKSLNEKLSGEFLSMKMVMMTLCVQSTSSYWHSVTKMLLAQLQTQYLMFVKVRENTELEKL